MRHDLLVALSKVEKEVEMKLGFNDDGWKDLTADQATKLVSHLPLHMRVLQIYNAKFRVKFMKALIEHVGKSKKLKGLYLDNISCDDAYEGEELGVQLAEVISTNTTIETLYLWNINLLVVNNANRWGESLNHRMF